jgi:E3 ubiquitin-protein ligase HERC2
LCITDDDNVWSWGDGDYGKLGRGGSDGCKVPVRIDTLHGLGVVKVECGSQFSLALTRTGAVYTWFVSTSILCMYCFVNCFWCE